MKKLLLLMMTGLLAITVLAACGDDDDTAVNENDNTETDVTEEGETQNENGDNETDTDDESNDSSEETNNEDASESESSDGGLFEVTEEPQMDLGVGDTGLVQTSIGKYELTLDAAEIVGTELDGEESLLDELMVLELTFKNIDDKPLIAEDLMFNLGLTSSLEGSNTSNNAEFFESIAVFEGEIAPGEEKQAQFIADVKTSEEYYFRPNPGVVANSTHNDLLWTITDEEARNE